MIGIKASGKKIFTQSNTKSNKKFCIFTRFSNRKRKYSVLCKCITGAHHTHITHYELEPAWACRWASECLFFSFGSLLSLFFLHRLILLFVFFSLLLSGRFFYSFIFQLLYQIAECRSSMLCCECFCMSRTYT